MSKKVWLAIVAIAMAGGGASAAELNTLSALKVEKTASGARVIVSGSRAPTFTVFRLPDPDRLVVDLSGADAAAVKGHHDGLGPVVGVVASQFSDAHASVGRVLVSLGEKARYDVRADGSTVVITVESGIADAAEPAKADEVKVASAPAKDAEAAKAEPEAPAAEASATAAEAGVAKDSRENVVASKVEEKEVAHPAHAIVGLSLRSDGFEVKTDGELGRFEMLELQSPPRLALDVYGTQLRAKAPAAQGKWVKGVRAAAHEDKVRIVLDLADGAPSFVPERTSHGVRLKVASAAAKTPAVVSAKSEQAAEAKAEPTAKPEAKAEAEIDGQTLTLAEVAPLKVEEKKAEPKKAATAAAKLTDLKFVDDPNGGKIELSMEGEAQWKVERPDPRSAVLTLSPAILPKKLERSLDTSALETPVKTVSAFSAQGGDAKTVRVVVASSDPLEDAVVRSATGLSWRLTAKGVRTEEVAVSRESAGFAQEAATYAEEGAPHARGGARYQGKKVSFEFKDIDIHNLLRVIAEVSKKNIVVADDVHGTVTIRLRNVPWDQALELILRSKGLGKETIGNIIRVAPLSTLQAEAKLREDRQKSLHNQAPLSVRLLPVNYATADDLQARVKDVLSDRGSVSVDKRTNVLIVKDVAENLSRAQSLVRNLDNQTPQVLIESRIIEAGTTFSRQIGVQWGGNAGFSPATGNPTGLAFPYTAVVNGGSSPVGTLGLSGAAAAAPNYAVNLPAAVGVGSGGALGFTFGSVGGAVGLNLRISALENQGTVKTISAPRVTTLDNNPAKISQGISIPFSQVSANGVNTTFVEARLQLEVTPHITQDGSILMQIKATNNQPDPSNTGANGQPSIQKKEADTQVLVKDGDTTVIGGIYVRRGSHTENGVPFFSKIPLLGYLFRERAETDSRQEMLIFITPRIINRTTISQTL